MFAGLKKGLPVTVKYKKEGDKLGAVKISVRMSKTTGMAESQIHKKVSWIFQRLDKTFSSFLDLNTNIDFSPMV
jgi:hypothetical protein